MTTDFRCATCGGTHEGFPDSMIAAPYFWYTVPEEERETRGRLDEETCVIDDEDCFVRSSIRIPILGAEESLRYEVWTTLSKTDFDRFVGLGGRLGSKPSETFSGRFSVRVPGYPDTLGLKATVLLQKAPDRPMVQLEQGDHTLAIEQRIGITRARATDLIGAAWHPGQHEIDENLAAYVPCRHHEYGHPAYLCVHLVAGGAEAIRWPETQTDTPWPDARCERCKQALAEDGGRADRSEAATHLRRVCSGCYDRIRRRFVPEA